MMWLQIRDILALYDTYVKESSSVEAIFQIQLCIMVGKQSEESDLNCLPSIHSYMGMIGKLVPDLQNTIPNV